MSKNVAVFVDVANIFYAAKAAGVDIDYVTLLKSATAGRDFVRAYAYTGLDPENENQRNFHAFLARSGYKVVSKDIRKYGDGRVKANLDIELVVDMMRMAEHLDVAVVVSGDGDFAPAIHAVQQRGVRVEVISFRGNTSSDLIDVADVFIDIAQVAKVEKGARSGRRVASDGDLSMTEVPDKESGVTPRRRRRRPDDDRSERPSRARRGSRKPAEAVEPAERAEPVDTDAAALVPLPGEKLSRAEAEAPAPADAPTEAGEAAVGEGEDAGDGSGRRRRRRRGGRGRGRGRGEDAVAAESSNGSATEPAAEQAAEPAGPDDAAEFPDEVPTLPQHSGFGSVWDSQIGVPGGTDTATPSDVDEEDIEGEPEVPEYLLAEKNQSRRRGGRGRGGRQGGYRSAIDRERYGSGGRGSGRRGGSRPPTGTASARAMEPIEQTRDGDPWSEVPADVQELLRAEMARRQDSPGTTAPDADAEATADADAAEEKPKRTTRKRTTRKAAPDADAEATADADAAEEKPKRTTRKRTTRKAAPDADAEATADADAAEEKPKRTTRKRTTRKAAADAEAEATADADAAEEKPKRTTRKRTTKKAAADAEAEAETPEPAVEA